MDFKRVVIPNSSQSCRNLNQKQLTDPFLNMQIKAKKLPLLRPLCLSHRKKIRSARLQPEEPKGNSLKSPMMLSKKTSSKQKKRIKLRPLVVPQKIRNNHEPLGISVDSTLANSEELPIFTRTAHHKHCKFNMRILVKNDNPNEVSFGRDDNSIIQGRNIFN